MGFLGYFFIIYITAFVGKACDIPPFKDVGWGWFIVLPIIVPLFRLLFAILAFCFYLAMGIAGMWLIWKIMMFVFVH